MSYIKHVLLYKILAVLTVTYCYWSMVLYPIACDYRRLPLIKDSEFNMCTYWVHRDTLVSLHWFYYTHMHTYIYINIMLIIV